MLFDSAVVITLLAIVLTGVLVGTLMCFVLFSLLVCGLMIVRRKGIYLGLAYLLIYTGAIAVLFVLVLLLADSRLMGLAVNLFAPRFWSRSANYILCLGFVQQWNFQAWSYSLVVSSKGCGASVKPAMLAAVVFGENIWTLFFSGLALIVVTCVVSFNST